MSSSACNNTQSTTLSVTDTVSTRSTAASTAIYTHSLHDALPIFKDGSGANIGTQTAGSAFTVKVTARDQFNNVKTDYAGTVHFAVGSADAGKTLQIG